MSNTFQLLSGFTFEMQIFGITPSVVRVGEISLHTIFEHNA